MSEVILAGIFLLLIPVNLWAVRETTRYALSKPTIDFLVLVARLVAVLAIVACVFGLFSFVNIFRIVTGVTLLAQPIPAVIFVTMALVASGANLLVVRYLWSRR